MRNESIACNFPFDILSFQIRLLFEAKTLLSVEHISYLCMRVLAVNFFSRNIPKNEKKVLTGLMSDVEGKSLSCPPLPAEFGCLVVSSFQSVLCENSWHLTQFPPKRSKS